jgi:hypothetical protein
MSEKWKSITTRHLYEQMTNGSEWKKREVITRATKSICARFLPLDKSLHKLLSRDDQLQQVVEMGWEAAATFAQQRCRLNLQPPANDIKKVESWWMDVVEELEYRPNFIFSVSPALIKWGNGYGQGMANSLVIVKSKVVSGN